MKRLLSDITKKILLPRLPAGSHFNPPAGIAIALDTLFHWSPPKAVKEYIAIEYRAHVSANPRIRNLMVFAPVTLGN